MKPKYPVEVPMPPAIMVSPVSGKTYAVGGKWVEIPAGTTRDELHKYVVHVKPKRDVESWQVQGSRGNVYTLRRVNGGKVTCSCPGYGWHKRCKHTKAVAA